MTAIVANRVLPVTWADTKGRTQRFIGKRFGRWTVLASSRTRARPPLALSL
jgi:hypothetical protein